jgi:hypothetical protein
MGKCTSMNWTYIVNKGVVIYTIFCASREKICLLLLYQCVSCCVNSCSLTAFNLNNCFLHTLYFIYIFILIFTRGWTYKPNLHVNQLKIWIICPYVLLNFIQTAIPGDILIFRSGSILIIIKYESYCVLFNTLLRIKMYFFRKGTFYVTLTIFLHITTRISFFAHHSSIRRDKWETFIFLPVFRHDHFRIILIFFQTVWWHLGLAIKRQTIQLNKRTLKCSSILLIAV